MLSSQVRIGLKFKAPSRGHTFFPHMDHRPSEALPCFSCGSFCCLFFLNCNISSLTVTKFLIAFIKSPYGKLRCSNKKQWLLTPIPVTGRLWLWPARVHVEIQAARFLTSITELRRCGSSEPVDPDFAAYSQIPAKEFFPGATWPMESCCLVQRSPDSILKQWEDWMVAKFILPWIWNPHFFMRIEKLKVVFALPRFTDLVDPVFTAYRS